jgi:Shedu protein SduA, C-terminal
MPPNDDDLSTIRRVPAQSGRVSYGDPVLLHETSKRRVQFVPFFVPRSDGTDLAIKVITYRKADPPHTWAVVEEKSISLDEAAARKLLRGLRDHLRVADEDADGSYILIRVSEGTAQIGEHDPKAVASALAKVLSSHEIIDHLAETDLSEELISAFRGAIRLSEMRRAVAQLHQFLNSGETSEQTYQTWCESHSWAFGNAYVMRDEVREISPGDHLDLLLPTVISGYRDIVELKRPDMPVLFYDEIHRNYYFSADVSKAIGQCHRYLDVLHEVAAQGLRDHPEIVAYHPRAIMVIGRSGDWRTEQLKALHGLNRRLAGLTVMTYDQLVAQGERLIEILSAKATAEEPAAEEFETLTDEDIPF